MDILLDVDTHDLVFINGETPVTPTIRTSVAQRLKIMLQTFLGEWFMDIDSGVPYFESIFGKVLNKSAVDLILQSKILEDPGVIEIVSFDSSVDNQRRIYSMSFRVRTSEGVTDTATFNLGL